MPDKEMKGIVTKSGNTIVISGYREDWQRLDEPLRLMLGRFVVARNAGEADDVVVVTFRLQGKHVND